jgi:F-type H+-transporting ATPase subunit alpha
VAGDLKLAYAQFEELETFARFGARLDDNTRKIIEHGRRIRACLKQPEGSPASVPAQIAVLLALTAELFDPVPLDKMIDAERAVQTAASGIAPDVCARFETATKLSDEDRKAIVEIARQALAPFQPKPEPKPEAKPEPKPEAKTEPKPKPDAKTEPKPKPDAKTEPKPEPGAKPVAPADVTAKPKPELKEKS